MIIKNSGDINQSVSEDSETEVPFNPILPEVAVPTLEEDEEVVVTLRAKLYRFDRSDDIPEWKERGIGEVKMLKHRGNHTVRLVMRRDKTLKVCANHFITPLMELKTKPGTDKAFVYNVPADFADEAVKSECLAIKFGSSDLANQFRKHFSESQEYVRKECKLYNGEADSELNEHDSDSDSSLDHSDTEESTEKVPETDQVVEKLKELNVAKEK